MPWYDPHNDILYISKEQYDLNIRKELKVNNQSAWTLRREMKFMDRGWTRYGTT